MILAARGKKAASAVGAIAAVLWLLYRRYTSQRTKGRPRTTSTTKSGGSATQSATQAGAALKPPPENPSVEAHVQAAAQWHRNGLRGETLLGEDGGISVYSTPLNPWLAALTSMLSPMGRSGEAVVAAICAFILVVMIAGGSFGRAWPVAGMLATLLAALALAGIAASLEGKGKRSGMLAETLEASIASMSSLGVGAVLLHAQIEVPQGDQAASMWQAAYRRASAPRSSRASGGRGGGGEQGFARRDGLGILVVQVEQVNSSAVSSAMSGLVEVFVLQPLVPSAADDGSSGLAVHHYAAARTRLCGPAAAAAASAPLCAFLAEAEAGHVTVSGAGAQCPLGADGAASAEQLARQVLEKAVLLSDGGKWEDAESIGPLRLSTQDAGTRFPMIRGVVEVPSSEVAELGHEVESPAERSALFAQEIFCFYCSALGQQLVDPMKGTTKLLQSFSMEDISAWLVYSSWKGNPMMPAADGVFFQAVKRQPAEGGGARTTYVTVPAPPALAASHTNEVEAVRAGQKYKAQKLVFLAMDVLARADGSLRACCTFHADPDVSRMTPFKMVRSALVAWPKCCLAYVEMAKGLTVPNPISLQSPTADEEMEEVQIAGRPIQVSKCVAGVLADRAAA